MAGQTIGVVSDIHGNKPALQAVLDDMQSVDRLVCPGDIIGILGWSPWCVDTVQEEFDDVVFGNHDARVRSDFAYAPSFPAAQDEHRIVTEQLDEEQVEWINSLPDRIETDDYVLAHSQPYYFRDPGYPHHGFSEGDRGVMPKDYTRVGPHLGGKVAILGHTHEQHGLDCSKFEGQSGVVVNPGSCGVPWYSDAQYAVVDTEVMEFELCSVEYDNDLVADQLEAQGTTPGKYSSGSSRFNR